MGPLYPKYLVSFVRVNEDMENQFPLSLNVIMALPAIQNTWAWHAGNWAETDPISELQLEGSDMRFCKADLN